MNNQQLNNLTSYDVVEGVDFVTPFNILLFPIRAILHFGNSREICFFNCSLFLNPRNCVVSDFLFFLINGIDFKGKQHLNIFLFSKILSNSIRKSSSKRGNHNHG